MLCRNQLSRRVPADKHYVLPLAANTESSTWIWLLQVFPIIWAAGIPQAALAGRQGKAPQSWWTQQLSAKVAVSVWGWTKGFLRWQVTTQSKTTLGVRFKSCGDTRPLLLCADHKKKPVWRDYLRRKKRWTKSSDMSLCFRSSSSPCCLCDCEKSLFLSGTSKINKETSRYNSNIFRAPTKCHAHTTCGVLAGGLQLNKTLNVYT